MAQEANAGKTGGGLVIRVGMVLPTADAAGSRAALASVRIRFQRFCAALEDSIRVRIVARSFNDYASMLKAVHDKELEIAWMPPLVAAHSAAVGDTVPIVVPVRGEQPFFFSSLFSRKDSKIQSLEDLKGVRAVWVDQKSMAGYVVIRAHLRKEGVDIASAFSSESFVRAHASVVEAVSNGSADVGATFVHLAADGHVESAGWGDASVNIISTAGPIPSDVLAKRKELPEVTAACVVEALTHEVTDDVRAAALALFEADRFVKAQPEHVKPLVELLGHMGDTEF